MPLGEGWYIDLNTGQAVKVYEHAHDVMENPKKFRVHPKEIAGLIPTNPTDRDIIRRLVLKRGFARVRAHGSSVVIEFDMKAEDAIPMIIPFLTETFGPNTWVAFHDLMLHRQYTDIKVSELEDQDRLNQTFGLFEHKSIKLSSLYEDYDVTPVGSRKYATGTEKLVRGPKSGAGAGVHPPERGDISRISDVGSEPYTKDTVKPSEQPKQGRIGKRPAIRRPLDR